MQLYYRIERALGLVAMVIVFVFLSSMTISAMYSSSPPDAKTGAPGEGLCTDCHSGVVNSGNGSTGISISPTVYLPGQTYTVTISLEDPDQSRWGFEITALDGNSGVGDFVITDAVGTQESSSGGREYVKQTDAGTYAGTVNGPVQWSVEWVAPNVELESVDFYVAGNAANNAAGTNGDYIYTSNTSLTAVATSVPVLDYFGLASLILIVLLCGIAVTQLVAVRTRQ